MKVSRATGSKAYLIPYPVESFSKPILIEFKNTYIGRDPNDSIQIANAQISRKHALITAENGRYQLEDLGSQNGTYLNHERIDKTALNSHDKITIGNRTFLFLLQSETIGKLMMAPSIAATDTIAISADELDLSEMWAQNAQLAAQGFFQYAADQHQDKAPPDSLAHTRLSLLYRLSENLRETNDIKPIYDQGLDLILEAIPAADYALVATKSRTDESFNIVACKLPDDNTFDGDAIPISHTLFDWVLLEKVTLVSHNICNDIRFQDSDSIRVHNLRSIVCAPIIRKQNVIGLLYAGSHSIVNAMSQADALFASAVANELALNIDNLQLQKTALINERMAAIGLTITNLAHNIKNLIALNQGAVQLMDIHVKEMANPKIEKTWEWIQQSFSGINRLSAGMLAYVKEDNLQLKPLEINQSILNYRKAFENSLSYTHLKFEFSLSKDKTVWMMDEAQFQRALFNLVINAADAVKNNKKGRIRISTSVSKDQHLTVSVMDNGIGIPSQKMGKVLELFFTTKGTSGTGLGLPMVQKFVEKSGGKLEFESKEGSGSIFKMIFPKI